MLAAICLLPAGCRRSGPEVVPVEGKITFGGGAWPKPGTLFFTPAENAPGLPRRPAVAEFGTDGAFQVTSFRPGDGLVPGRYLVGVECWETPPTMSGPQAKSHVPAKYQSPATSGLEVKVEPGQKKVVISWDVPKG